VGCAAWGFGIFVSSALALAASHPVQSPSTTKPVSAGWFTDVSGKSKFDYYTNNDYRTTKYFPQPMCGGVAAFDYDNDGKEDLFFTNGATLPEETKSKSSFYNALLHNNGDGTFDDVTAKAGLDGEHLGYSFGVAAGDYDNSGSEDLFIASAGRNTLYRNNGDGTFTDVTVGSGLEHKPDNLLSVGAAWFDYDNDGLLDLIVSNYTTWTPATDQRCLQTSYDGEGAQKTGHPAESYCSPTLYKSVSPRLYHNLGHGRFDDVTEKAGLSNALGKGMGISIADFSGNGRMDIFIANDTERNFLFVNQGDGTFREEGLLYGVAYAQSGAAVSSMGSDAKDYDNDGRVDLIYNDLAGQIFGIFHNAGNGVFDDVAAQTGILAASRPYAGWSMGFIDYDNDGWKDIYSANGDVDDLLPTAKQHDSMFRNIDGKTFIDVSDSMGKDFLFRGFQRGSAFADLNNDGFMDIVVTSLGRHPRILLNRATTGNHWVMLDLRGTRSNRDGIGAKIKVVTLSGRVLYNHVTTSVGFMSSSDRRAHFGLGKEGRIREIEINWPSGIVQRLENPAADRILRVEEPAESSDQKTPNVPDGAGTKAGTTPR
jgi:hypothetical protein